ncbi:MAG: hypothetical protein ACRDB0_00035 [Paraclostridium sp.]
MKDIKKFTKISIALYSCSLIMVICTVFIIYKSNTYISSLVSQGFNPSREIAEVINYYLSTVTPFIFYTIVLFALGYIVQKINVIIQDKELIISKNELLDKISKDDEIDDLFINI